MRLSQLSPRKTSLIIAYTKGGAILRHHALDLVNVPAPKNAAGS